MFMVDHHNRSVDGIFLGIYGEIAVPKRAELMSARRAATITKPGFHAAGGTQGLYLQVTTGGRSWVLRYRLAGRRRNMGIGPADTIGLAEARELAAAARR